MAARVEHVVNCMRCGRASEAFQLLDEDVATRGYIPLAYLTNSDLRECILLQEHFRRIEARLIGPLPSRRHVRLQVHRGPIYCLAFSPDSSLLASGGRDEQVVVWDVDAKTHLYSISHADEPPEYPEDGYVAGLAFSPDGTHLAVGGRGGHLRIYDARTGRHRSTLVADHLGRAHLYAVLSIAYSPDGSLLVSGGDEAVCVWDAFSGKLWHRLNPDGELDQGDWRRVAFSSDGSILFCGTGRMIHTWNVSENFTAMEQYPLDWHGAGRIAPSPDGRWLAHSESDLDPHLLDLQSGTCITLHTKYWLNTRNVAFHPQGRILAAVGTGGSATAGEDGLKLWDTVSLRQIRTYHEEQAYELALSPNGCLYAIAKKDGTVVVWS